MKLVIAFLLIYGLGLSWWLYLAVFAIWAVTLVWELRVEDDFRRRIEDCAKEVRRLDRRVQ